MTEQGRTREELLQAESRLKAQLKRARQAVVKLKAILDALGEGVTVQDRDFRVLYQNKAHQEIFGDHLGETCYHGYNQKSEVCEGCHLKESLEEEQILTKERRIQSRKGEIYIEVTEAPLRDPEGRVIGGVGIVRNITEKKIMEEELLRKLKLESIGILAGGIAHDFNNIMTAILGNISLVKLDEEEASESHRRLTEAENATLLAKDLTHQLLTFSMGGAPVKKTVSMGDLVEKAVSLSLTGSNVKCDLSIPADLWPVEADPGQMNQVIYNLVVNADQAMPEGGIVRVTSENVSVSEGNLLSLSTGDYIKVSVQDEGKGMNPEELARIFDPYFTSHKLGSEKGRGLGLAITYSIIQEHRGHIDVTSTIGVGSTFSVYLPASTRTVTAGAENEEELICGTGKVLLMDDEEFVRDVASKMLNRIGYDVLCAKDGAETIALYLEAKQSDRPFDAVLMDVTIPGGMGGKETIARLLEVDPQARVIVSSGYANDPVMSNYEKHGFHAVIRKPYKIQEISRTLHRVITQDKPVPKGPVGGP